MVIFGYARASTQGQTLDSQVATLKAAGAEKIFKEKTAGAHGERPQLARMLAAIGEKDVLIVTRLDQLARSPRDLLDIAEALKERDASFRSLNDPWADTTGARGRPLLTALSGLAAFERELVRARTSDGRVKAVARGRHMGRRATLNPHQKQAALKALADASATQADLARQYKVSQSTISRLVSKKLGTKELALKEAARHMRPPLGKETELAAREFMRRLEGKYPLVEGIVFGSRARGDHKPDSDADLAVVLKGRRGDRWAAAGEMARIAFDVMLEMHVLVDPLPLWESELKRPQLFSNPELIENIKCEGLRL